MFPHFPVWFPIQVFVSFFPFLPICHWYITCPLQAAVNISVIQIMCMSNSFYVPKHQHLHKPIGDMDLVINDRILMVWTLQCSFSNYGRHSHHVYNLALNHFPRKCNTGTLGKMGYTV
jgi:hypothetical protein